MADEKACTQVTKPLQLAIATPDWAPGTPPTDWNANEARNVSHLALEIEYPESGVILSQQEVDSTTSHDLQLPGF